MYSEQEDAHSHSDEVLSDVHIYNTYTLIEDHGYAITRFKFTIPWWLSGLTSAGSSTTESTPRHAQDITMIGCYTVTSHGEPARKRSKSDNCNKTVDDDGDIVVRGRHVDHGDVDPDGTKQLATDDDGDVVVGRRHVDHDDVNIDGTKQLTTDDDGDVVVRKRHVDNDDVDIDGTKQLATDDDGDVVVGRRHVDHDDVDIDGTKQLTMDDDGDVVVRGSHVDHGDVDPDGTKQLTTDDDGDVVVRKRHVDHDDVDIDGTKQLTTDNDGDVVRRRHVDHGDVDLDGTKQLTTDDDGDVVVHRRHVDHDDVDLDGTKQLTTDNDGDVVVHRRHVDHDDVDLDGTKQLTTDDDGDVVVRRRHVDHDDVDHDGTKQLTTDDDGDVVVRGSHDVEIYVEPDGTECAPYVINIKHSLSTGLAQVGEQVWQGALLLCDYIIHEHEMLRGQTVVDLGAGTGLTSIVAAMCADMVYCTDVGENVLTMASHNVHAATEFSTVPRLCPILTRELDWFRHLSVCVEKTQFGMDTSDVAGIQAAEIILAADVIYDDDITDAFFKTVTSLMSQPPAKTLVIGLERRLVFTIEDLDVSSPGYNHFKKHLDNLSPHEEERNLYTFHVLQIKSQDIPQYFDYRRTRHLEIWTIRSKLVTDH